MPAAMKILQVCMITQIDASRSKEAVQVWNLLPWAAAAQHNPSRPPRPRGGLTLVPAPRTPQAAPGSHPLDPTAADPQLQATAWRDLSSQAAMAPQQPGGNAFELLPSAHLLVFLYSVVLRAPQFDHVPHRRPDPSIYGCSDVQDDDLGSRTRSTVRGHFGSDHSADLRQGPEILPALQHVTALGLDAYVPAECWPFANVVLVVQCHARQMLVKAPWDPSFSFQTCSLGISRPPDSPHAPVH